MDVTHYQRISDNDDIDHDIQQQHDSLWDELNDEQSREVQQHQSRFHPHSSSSRTNPTIILTSMIQNAAEQTANAAQQTYTAAQQAWHDYQQQQQQQHATTQRYQTHDLDEEFGLHDLRTQSNNNTDEANLFESVNNSNNGTPSSRGNGDNNNNNNADRDGGTGLQPANNSQSSSRFVHLQNFPRNIMQQPESDSWGLQSNLDVFVTHLYNYYYNRGLTSMICTFLVEFISLLLTLWLSVILFQRVNWKLLATCTDETTCLTNWSDYYYYSDSTTTTITTDAPTTTPATSTNSPTSSPTTISTENYDGEGDGDGGGDGGIFHSSSWFSYVVAAVATNNDTSHASFFSSSTSSSSIDNTTLSDEDNVSTSATIGWIHWIWIQGYIWLFLLYGAFRLWSFWQNLQHAQVCSFVVHEKLGISKRKLHGGAISWDTIVSRLRQVQDSGEYRIINTTTTATAATTATATATAATNMNGDNGGGIGNQRRGQENYNNTDSNSSSSSSSSLLDPLSIAQRIMRKENFLIAFWNQRGLLDTATRIGSRQYWCSSLEWCLHTCILNFMFNHKYEIRPAFYLDAASLQRRLQVCGIVHLLLLPFLMIFVILHFILKNVYDFKTTRQYMGDKQWSTVAQWTFREFNELPHIFEQRLEPSYEAADNYAKLFGTSEYMAALGQLLVFTGGSVGSIILVLGVMNDAILLHVQLWGRNLLWYGGIAGIIYSVGKALLPTKESQPSVSRNLFADMDTSLKNVSTHTHYYPEHWKGRGWDSNVYKSFGKFFDSKVKLFVWEMAALILAPYILFARLSKVAPAICEFCLAVKCRVPADVGGAGGDICGYSSFDFDTFGDEAWEGRTLGKSVAMMQQHQQQQHPTESLSESILRTGNVEDATRRHPKPKAREGKMEKSFFNFQSAHPNWKCSPSGQSLVDRVEQYRQAELAAISRERGLYIEAAARQLETLARLEQKQQLLSPNHPDYNPTRRFQEERLHDSHHVFATAVPPADAGAGSQYATTTTATQMQQQPQQVLTNRRGRFVRPSSPTYPAGPPPPILPSLSHHHHSIRQEHQQQLPNVATSTAPAPQTIPFPQHETTTIPEESPLQQSSSSSNSRQVIQNESDPPESSTAALSTELRRILDMSTSLHAPDSGGSGSSALPDTNVATPGSLLLQHPDTAATSKRTPSEQQVCVNLIRCVHLLIALLQLRLTLHYVQYYWLERFHEHLEQQHQHEGPSIGGNGSLPASSHVTNNPNRQQEEQDVNNRNGGDEVPEISRSMPTRFESSTPNQSSKDNSKSSIV